MSQFALFDDAPVHLNPKGKTARKQAAQAAREPVIEAPKKVKLEVTRSTGEAMALLNKSRKEYIALARAIAVELIGKNGSTHTFAVRDEMASAKLLRSDIYEGEFWLGAVFRCDLFVKTGETHVDPPSERNKIRNIHSHHKSFVWRLADAG